MSKAIEKIEKEFRLPCGPMEVSADAVCRRRLKDSMDTLLDRLTEEIHPGYIKPESPKGKKFSEDGKIVDQKKGPNDPNEKRKKMLEHGKLRIEVNQELKNYEEQLLQGNSKLLQDITGKVQKR